MSATRFPPRSSPAFSPRRSEHQRRPLVSSRASATVSPAWPASAAAPSQAPKARERVPIRLRIRPVLQGPLKSLFAGIGAFEFGNCAATLLILRATELLDPGRSHTNAATTALWLYVSYNAAATLTSIPAGRHADRTTAKRTLTIGVAAFGLAYAGLTRDTNS